MNFLQLFQGTHGNSHKTNFEHVQYALHHPSDFLLINTLPVYEQTCLIQSTIAASEEEIIVNAMIRNVNVPDKKIIVYGKHANDESAETKYNQLVEMGLREVYIYTGGLFEWMLLQDIYGQEEFPTTETVLDILKFRPPKLF